MLNLIDISQPGSNIIKRFAICYVVNKHYTHRTTIICCSYCFKSLLSGRIPYLKLNFTTVQINCFYFEINTFL